MQTVTIKAHIGRDGTLKLDLPQFRDVDVEVMVRETVETVLDQMAIFEIPPLRLDANHTAIHFLSREDLYGDDGR